MASLNAQTPARKSLIGSPSNFWLHHSTHGFNLTHPSTPTTPVATPTVTIQSTTTPVTIDPSKSALVIIDMQNFFLSPSLGRTPGGPGHIASDNLITHAIPAARKAGIRIIWLNWGLDKDDMCTMPPAVRRCFGFHAIPEGDEFERDFSPGAGSVGVDQFGVPRDKHGRRAMYRGLGAPCGTVTLPSGEAIDAGDLLVRDSWNADIYPPLKSLYNPDTDAWIHKNRMSGLWGSDTPLQAYLGKEGLRTLFFAGVNTDQCVGGTLTDAFSRGYDCVMLSDGCGTSSGEGAQRAWEWNAERTYGFCVTCEGFARAVGDM